MDQICIDKDLSELSCSMVSWGIYFGYVFFGVAAIAAIVLPMINVAKNPKILVKAGISIVVLVVVFVISYAVSGSERSAIAVAQGVSEAGSRMVSAGLIVFYIALIVSALGLVYSEVSKAFK